MLQIESVSGDRRQTNRPGRKAPIEALNLILNIAFDAFSAHGYEGVSMRQIAREAGTSIQRLVYHFPTKDDLWKGVIKRVVQQSEERRRKVLDSLPDAPPAIQLRHLIRDMVEFLAAFPGVHRIMTFEAAQSTPRLQWLCENLLISQVRETVEIIEAAQRDGAVRQVDPARLRYAILSICAVPFTIAAEFEATTGHDPFRPDEINATIDFICTLVFIDG